MNNEPFGVLDFPHSEAFLWWNRLGNPSCNDSGPPELPSVGQILWKLLAVAPALYLAYDRGECDELFWPRLEQAVSEITGTMDFPSPKRRFPEFVGFVYENLQQLASKTPKVVSKVIELRRKTNDPGFLLWSVPEVLGNPGLYFDVLIYLRSRKSEVFRCFVNGVGNVDLLFDRYLPMMSGAAPVQMVGFLLSLYIERIRYMANAAECSETFFNTLIGVVGSKNASLSVEVFRGLVLIFSLSKCLFPDEHHAKWMADLVNATIENPMLRVMTVNFCIQMQQPGFKSMDLCRALMNCEVCDGWQLLLLGKAVMGMTIKTPVVIAKFLYEKGTRDEIMAVTCAECLAPVYEKYGNNAQMNEWVGKFMRKCFLFVAVSSERHRYRNRVNTILCFYEALMSINVEPVNDLITKYFSTVVALGFVKCPMYDIPYDAVVDFALRADIDGALKTNMNVKQAMEYNPIGEAPKVASARQLTAVKRKRPTITLPTKTKAPPDTRLRNRSGIRLSRR